MDFGYQGDYKHVDIWVDSDWAGDRKDRKSTSGGVVRLGNHTVKTWSSTQKTIALSSGEAEFQAIVKGGSIGIGMRSMLGDLGVPISNSRVHINTDSSAAKGICNRMGLGKIRHLDVHDLWVQERVRLGDLIIKKVPGESNLSDGLTKHLPHNKMAPHMENTNQRFLPGRHPLMPRITSNQ